MNLSRHLYRAAALAGMLALAWVAAGYLRPSLLAHPLALGMTLLIGACYALGVVELHRFRRATAGLQQALDQLAAPPARLDDWLTQVPATLRPAVQARVLGERAALPGPALTPYLVGLLVLLGMLGTFLGMVVTLNGTGMALDSATDAAAMREALSAPVRGLGLAFGTSVAGVAASAMLGLMSALSRQARAQAGQRLDAQAAGTLQRFSHAHALQLQREQALQLQAQQTQQAQALPQLVGQIAQLAAQLQQQAQQSHAQLLASQQRFHEGARANYRALAESVDQSLQRSLSQSLAEGTRVAAAALQPAVQATLAGLGREASQLHSQLSGAVQQQLAGQAQRFEAQTQAWLAAAGSRLDQQAQALLDGLAQAQARQQAEQAAQAAAQGAAWLAGLQAIGVQVQDQARDTVAEVARLAQAAAEAPRAAASLVAELRGQASQSLARDKALLEERGQVLDTLHTLLGTVQQAAAGQQAAIAQMVQASSAWLEDAGTRFSAQVQADSARLDSLAAQLGSSAAEVASLGEAFGTAVELFGQSSGQVVAQLQRVEAALAQHGTRSDEQLAYYVAQAREVIDLSLLSQRQIVDDLQRLARQQASVAA